MKFCSHYIFVFLLMVLFLGCSSSDPELEPSSVTGTEEEIILDKFQRIVSDFSEENNPEAAADLYLSIHTPDAILMIPGSTTIAGRDAIRPFIVEFAREYKFIFEDWTSNELVVSDNLAFHRFTGVAVMIHRTNRDTIRQNRKYLDVWRKSSNGEWRIARHMYNLNQ